MKGAYYDKLYLNENEGALIQAELDVSKTETVGR